jgi:HD superfamily phosphohydrolase
MATLEEPVDPVVPPPITLPDLTTALINGTGVFDVLMRAMTVHLDREWTEQRLKGQDYAQVYLGSVTAILTNSVQFLLQKDKASLDSSLVASQIKLIETQILTAKSQNALTDAQTLKVKQETSNLKLEADNLIAQNCLLKAQYDLTMMNKLQTIAQTSLVQQKIATEKAQTIETGVDDNSVIGKQKLLYKAQTDGFARDSEQKMLKVMVDSWSVRRTTDEGTEANAANGLYDTNIGRVVTKSLTGIGA